MRCEIHCPSRAGSLVVLVLGALGTVVAAVVWVAANLWLAAAVLAVTAALSAAAYAAAHWVSKTVLRVLGRMVVPVGYRRLRPAAPAPDPVVLSAIEACAPLAIEPPRVFVAGEVVAEPAASEVVINGTRYQVLS
jgi:hypothetical protein